MLLVTDDHIAYSSEAAGESRHQHGWSLRLLHHHARTHRPSSFCVKRHSFHLKPGGKKRTKEAFGAQKEPHEKKQGYRVTTLPGTDQAHVILTAICNFQNRYNERLMGLVGRVAVVTGASRGLGKAMALALASAGARVALVSRDQEKLNQVAAEARASGGEAEGFCADVGDEAQVLRLEREVVAWFGRVDILINNAGIVVRKPCVDLTLTEWSSVLNTNLTSAFLMCRSFVPHMKGRGYGRILNIASAMAHMSLPGRTAYSSSKSGLLGFTRSLALELAQEGITVVSISPGVFATELVEPALSDPKVKEVFGARTAVGRWGKPEELGKLVLYLCSDDASFITGSDIAIDGGWTAQ